MEQPLGFQIQDMKQAKIGVRNHLRTSSFGFTLIETVIAMMVNALVIMSFLQIMRVMPHQDADTFTQEKIKIRSYDMLNCIEGKLLNDDINLNVDCIESSTMIQVYLEGKVFYVKKQSGIYTH